MAARTASRFAIVGGGLSSLKSGNLFEISTEIWVVVFFIVCFVVVVVVALLLLSCRLNRLLSVVIISGTE